MVLLLEGYAFGAICHSLGSGYRVVQLADLVFLWLWLWDTLR